MPDTTAPDTTEPTTPADPDGVLVEIAQLLDLPAEATTEQIIKAIEQLDVAAGVDEDAGEKLDPETLGRLAARNIRPSSLIAARRHIAKG